MAKPTGALDVTSDTADPLTIGLETWNNYDPDGWQDEPIRMYVISRVPLVPGQLMDDGADGAARFRLGMSTGGATNEPGLVSAQIFRDKYGTSNTLLGAASLEAGEAEWIECFRTDNWATYPAGFAMHGPIEITMKHGNITVSQDAFNVLGLWAYWFSDDDDPLATDRVDWMVKNADSDPTTDSLSFCSAWHCMSGHALSQNTYTYMNCGGFGCGVFSVPFFGYPEPA